MRQLDEKEKEFNLKGIKRSEEEVDRLRYLIEGDEFQLSRLDKTFEISYKEQKKRLNNSLRDSKLELDTKLKNIEILKEQIDKGVEEKNGNDE